MNEDAFQILNCMPYLYKTIQEEELWDAFMLKRKEKEKGINF